MFIHVCTLYMPYSYKPTPLLLPTENGASIKKINLKCNLKSNFKFQLLTKKVIRLLFNHIKKN